MTDNLFNTPAEEVDRLVAELRDTREALREVSSKLTHIETRLKRAFPGAFAKGTAKQGKSISGQETSSLSPEKAMLLYGELVDLARKDQMEDARHRLSSMSIPDLSFLRHELGASLGEKKASLKVLTDVILGRVKESVMLSRHSNRQELMDQGRRTKNSKPEGGKD